MVGQIVAYVRVSSTEQNEARQVDTLAGANWVFMDKMSGKSSDRPALTELLAYVRDGDTVWVASLDRLIRERQAEGIAIAIANGVYRGRKPVLTAAQVDQARELVASGGPKAEVARRLGVSRQTLYSALGTTETAVTVLA